MSKKPDAPKGRLSFCLNCKKDTETVIVRESGVFGMWPFKASYRMCKECAKPKVESKLEMEDASV